MERDKLAVNTKNEQTNEQLIDNVIAEAVDKPEPPEMKEIEIQTN